MGGCNIYVSRFFPISCHWAVSLSHSHSHFQSVSPVTLSVCVGVCLYQYSFVDSVDGTRERAQWIHFSHAIVTWWWVRWGCFIRMKKKKEKNKTENYEATSTKRLAWARSHSCAHTRAHAHSLRKKKINKRFNFFRLLPCYWIVFESYVERIAERKQNELDRYGEEREEREAEEQKEVAYLVSFFYVFSSPGGCLNFGI